MAGGKETNDVSNGPTKTQTKVAAAPTGVAAGPEIIMVPTTVGLTGEQFFKLQRTLMFGMALGPIIAANPNITPTPKNIERVATFADLILKVVNGESGE